MSVELSHIAEAKRNNRVREIPTWGLLNSTSLVEALHFAKDNGWFEGRVQVRSEKTHSDVITYYVEPYEEGCGCSGILRYADYFDPPRHG